MTWHRCCAVAWMLLAAGRDVSVTAMSTDGELPVVDADSWREFQASHGRSGHHVLLLFTQQGDCVRCREAETVCEKAAPNLRASETPTVVAKVDVQAEASLALRMGVSTAPSAVLVRAEAGSPPELLDKVGRSPEEFARELERLLAKRPFRRPVELASMTELSALRRQQPVLLGLFERPWSQPAQRTAFYRVLASTARLFHERHVSEDHERAPIFAWAAWRRGEDASQLNVSQGLGIPAAATFPGVLLLRADGENPLPAVLAHPGAEDADLFTPRLLVRWFMKLRSVGAAWAGTEGAPVVCRLECVKVLGANEDDDGLSSFGGIAKGIYEQAKQSARQFQAEQRDEL